MYYELVNLSSGNRIGEFDTEAEALRDVDVYCRRFGQKALDGIALTEEDESGRGAVLAEGSELVARVERARLGRLFA